MDFLSGQGRMWRRHGEAEAIVEVAPGVSLSIPLGTHFQLRNDGKEPLAAVAVTMPPCPGENEAYFVEGRWPGSPTELCATGVSAVQQRRRLTAPT